MKKFIWFFIFSLFMSSQALSQIQWEKFGLKSTSAPMAPQSPLKQFEVSDNQGRNFTLNLFGVEPSQETVKELLAYKDQFFSFSQISLKKLIITLEPKASIFLLLPSKVAYMEKDLAPFLPGGITFILQEGKLSYNFRVLRDQYSFKVEGAFQSEPLLIEAIIKTRELQQKTQFVEQNQDELKSRLLKALKSGEAVAAKEPSSQETESPSLYLNAFLGSGTLTGLGLDYFPFSHLSFGPLAGVSYFQENGPDGKTIDLISIPAGLNSKFYFYRSSGLQAYLFASGFYRIPVQNAQSDFLYGGGAGLSLMDLFFAETSYFTSSSEGHLVFGLGIKFSL